MCACVLVCVGCVSMCSVSLCPCVHVLHVIMLQGEEGQGRRDRERDGKGE